MNEAQIRQIVVNTAKKYLGCKESVGSHKKIVDKYNSHKPLARGYKVKYTDAWCATFGSFIGIILGYTDIIPTECSCNKQIELWKKIGRWQEKDDYVPSPGDYIYYDWDDNGIGDCKGSSEHVGIVISVCGNNIEVIEGNKSDSVSIRKIKVNGKFIRGYGLPDYASKATTKTTKYDKTKKDLISVAKDVLAGKYGNGNERKVKLEKAGYSYEDVQKEVNKLKKK